MAYYTKEQRKKARETIDNMKTFGMMLSDAFKNQGVDYDELSQELSDQTHLVNPKIIKSWEEDKLYPDISIIYKLCEKYKLNPNEMLLAKQVMQECGVASVNVRLMKNISAVIEVSIWTIHYAIRIIPFAIVIIGLIIIGLRH